MVREREQSRLSILERWSREQLGLSTLSFFSLPLFEALTEVKALGFNRVEILCEEPHCSPIGLTEKEMNRVASFLERKELKASAHAPLSDLNPLSPNPGIRRETRRQLKKTIDFCQKIGAENMVFHIGHKSPFGLLDHMKIVSYAEETISPLLSYATKRGVALCLENNPQVKGAFGIEIEECLEFMSALGVELALDVGHANTLGSNAPKEFAQRAPKRIRVIHLNDNHGQYDEHLPIGDGSLDFHGLFQELLAIDYRGDFTIEVMTPSAATTSRHAFSKLVSQLECLG